MMINDCEKLLDYLQSMMNDGVQLVHGGNLLSWEDTQIPDILEQIKKQNTRDEMSYQPGDMLENKLSGQRAAIIRDTGELVHLLPEDNIIVYPKTVLGLHYTKI